MQKKINLLATLLAISIVLGGLSTCSSASFQEGFQVGTDEAMTKYEMGYKTGENLREKALCAYIADIRLLPRNDYRSYPFSILNKKTGEEVPMAPQVVRLAIPKEDEADFVWMPILMGAIAIGGVIAIILLLIIFVTSVKAGGVFLKNNEKALRWMGGILLGWYVLDWAMTLSAYFRTKELVSLEEYWVWFDAPNVYPLVLGFALLFFAQIFAKGRTMEEDQAFMV